MKQSAKGGDACEGDRKICWQEIYEGGRGVSLEQREESGY